MLNPAYQQLSDAGKAKADAAWTEHAAKEHARYTRDEEARRKRDEEREKEAKPVSMQVLGPMSMLERMALDAEEREKKKAQVAAAAVAAKEKHVPTDAEQRVSG